MSANSSPITQPFLVGSLLRNLADRVAPETLRL